MKPIPLSKIASITLKDKTFLTPAPDAFITDGHYIIKANAIKESNALDSINILQQLMPKHNIQHLDLNTLLRNLPNDYNFKYQKTNILIEKIRSFKLRLFINNNNKEMIFVNNDYVDIFELHTLYSNGKYCGVLTNEPDISKFTIAVMPCKKPDFYPDNVTVNLS